MERNHVTQAFWQSILLFVSFVMITVGVALEAATPIGFSNGCWAFSLVIPSTGFFLSLMNRHFVELYKSKKSFSNCSLLATLGITTAAYIWAGFHYEMNFIELLSDKSFLETMEILCAIILLYGRGIPLIVVFCVLSKSMSNKYAEAIGKK